jgi:PAS domain S-box-containing protein
MIRKFLSWPIRVHLLFLVILLALPSITLILYWGFTERDEAIEDSKDECLKFVNAAAGEQQAVVAGVQQLLSIIALLPEVQSRDASATGALLSDLLKKNPLISSIGISDMSGLIWASATPYEGAVSVADRKYFRNAVLSGRFSSGEFSVGRIVKRPVINFAQPIMNASNELTSVIAVSLNLDYIQSLFEKIHLPAGSSFGLLDHQGIILYRDSRDPFSEQLVGKRDSREELFTKMVEGPDEGTYEAMGNDGKVRLTAYKKLRLPHESQPYLYIRSSIPKASVVSAANAMILRNMAALITIFAIGMILAVYLGKRLIVEPITKLTEASRQLAAGPVTVNVSEQLKDSELGELAQAFDDMVQALLRKEKEQLASEEGLRVAHARAKWLARLPEENPNPVLRVSSDGHSLYCNPASIMLDGWKCEEGLPVPSPIFPLVRKSIAEDREVMQDVDLGGRTYWVAVSSFPEERYANVYGRDITERKQAEASLEEAKKSLEHERDLLQSVMNGATNSHLVYLDRDFNFIRVNETYAATCGYKPEEMIGKNHFALYPHAENEAIFARVRDTGIAAEFHDKPFVFPDQPERGVTYWDWTLIPIRDRDGQVGGLVFSLFETTERKRAEDRLRESEKALQEANEHLEQRVRERTMDLQNLTKQLESHRHDLRNLASELVTAEERERKRIADVLHDEIAQTLAAARMRIDILKGIPSDPQDRQTLEEAKALLVQSIQETRTLMTDIGNPLLFNMGLQAACESLADRLMQKHPIRIICDVREAFKHLNPDLKTILYQLIRELLNNVVKHSKAQNARVMVDMENGDFRLKVTDDGVGFDPRTLGTPTTESGFGLYSIRERLIAMNGSLKIESAPGTGTVVTAILPETSDRSQARPRE